MFSTDSKQPKILVFAGPNGSGKSTVTKGLPIVGLYVNADAIKLASGCSDLEAAKEAEAIRNMLLDGRKDFTFETVLSTERNIDLLRKARAAGYRICAVYVLTKDSAINVQRVHERTAAGGHDVPDEKIVSRYERSLKNLAPLARIAHLTRIIDNSGDEPNLICEIRGTEASISPNQYWTENEILTLLSNPE